MVGGLLSYRVGGLGFRVWGLGFSCSLWGALQFELAGRCFGGTVIGLTPARLKLDSLPQ